MNHTRKKNQHFRSQFFLMILTIKPGTSDSTLICCSYQFYILKRRRKGSLNSFSRCTNRFCVIIHDCSRLEKTSFLPQFRSSFIELDGQKKRRRKKFSLFAIYILCCREQFAPRSNLNL